MNVNKKSSVKQNIYVCYLIFFLLKRDSPCGAYGGEERCIQGFSGET
jgi:hypothetical protein